MNVIVQLRAFNWGALDLTPAQYEAIEETSHDPDTYDSVYNRACYEIKDFQASLFLDGLFPGRRICGPADSSGNSTLPTTDWRRCRTTLVSETYDIARDDVTELYAALSANGWDLLGRMYAIEGDIEVLVRASMTISGYPRILNAVCRRRERALCRSDF